MDLFDDTTVGDDDEDGALTGSAANDRLLGLGGGDQLGDGNGLAGGQGDDADPFLVGLGEGDDAGLDFGAEGIIDLRGTGIANFGDLLTEDGGDVALAALGDERSLTLRALEAAELGGANDNADDGDVLISGDADDDVLTGTEANDTFQFSAGGGDVITGFAANDLVDLNGIIDVTAFDDLDIANSDDGAASTLAGGEGLTFERIAAADLAAESFIFAEDGGIVIAGADSDDALDGTEADDRFAADLADSDIAGFDDFNAQDSDSSALLTLASGGTLSFDDLELAEAGDDRFNFAGDEGDGFAAQPDSGDDTIIGLQPDGLLDVSAVGLAGFDALDVQDSDDGAVLTADDGASLTFEDVDAGDLDPFDFLLDT